MINAALTINNRKSLQDKGAQDKGAHEFHSKNAEQIQKFQ